MILCVNANAAIDKTILIPGFQLDTIHRPQSVLSLPGGKGCNVARAIKNLGGEVLVTGWIGGFAGQFIESGLQAEGIKNEFVHIQEESRTCVSIIDPEKETLTEIYEKGCYVSKDEVGELEQKFVKLLSQVQLVTLSGSLPRGVPDDIYARLARSAREENRLVLLDSHGVVLNATLETGGVSLIKLNLEELVGLAGQDLPDLDAVQKFIAEISRQYNLIAVVTLGSQGALAGKNGQTWFAQPPFVHAMSAVGSGDSSLAAWALAIIQNKSIKDCLRSGVAAGTANTQEIGAGRFEKTEYLKFLNRINIS